MNLSKESIYKNALVHLSKGEINAALDLLLAVYRARSPLAERALLHILNALDKTDRLIEAIDLLDDACNTYPHNDKWPEALAAIWMRQGEFHKALSFADRALAINPDNETMFIPCKLACRFLERNCCTRHSFNTVKLSKR